MRIFFATLLAVSLLTTQPGVAQKGKDFGTVYNQALGDYKARRYSEAITKLAPLTNQSSPNRYAEYAHYYYALSAYQLKGYKESRQMLVQLMSRFPNWSKTNDANYLLGADYLGLGQWKEASAAFSKIKDSSFSEDVLSLKQNYLRGLQDLPAMINLQKQFPDDQTIVVELIQYIENSPKASSADQYYADQLKKKYKINPSKSEVAQQKNRKSIPRKDTQWTKGYINVSVLLPFRLSEFSAGKTRSNQFAYDYYLGLLQARDALAMEGVNIKFVTYDISTDNRQMDAIVDSPLFQESDLVLGPLYNQTFEMAAKYAEDHDMMVVNPLATDGTLLEGNSKIYLARPSIEFQTKKAAQQMKRVTPAMNVAIFYGSTSKDSSMAALYASEVKAKGGKILLTKKIGTSLEQLQTAIPEFATKKPDHVALFSSFSATGSNFIQILNDRKLSTVPVIASATSFKMNTRQLSKWGSRLYLIDTEYVEPEKVKEFQKRYYQANNTFPSIYSYQGYDQLLFFARILNKYKGDYQEGIATTKYTDEMENYLLGGFDYTKNHENQLSPVLRYDGSKWIRVN